MSALVLAGGGGAAAGDAVEVALEELLEPDEVVGQRQAEGLHLGEPLAQRLLQLVRVGRVAGDLVHQHRELKPEFLERHAILPVPRGRPACHNGTRPWP